MISKKLLRICPICGNGIGEILYTQKFSFPTENHLPKHYDVICCNTCGFVFADSSATQKEYDIYYEQLSKYENEATASGTGISSYDAERLNQTAREIKKFLPNKSAKILDVGAANGGLLLALRKLGYNSLTGMDPSPTCIHKMQSQGLKAVIGGIFSEVQINERFDCIVLSHVLEHLYDVRGGIKNLMSLLKDGGILYIEVPDAALYSQYFIVPFYYFDCEHINHFDESSIRNLLGLFGGTALEAQSKEILVSKNHSYPTLGVFYKKNDRAASSPILDFTVKQSVLKHIQQSLATEQGKEFEKLEKNAMPIIIFGAGQYTQRLLADTNLKRCNIIAFVDNDSKKQGLKLENIKIESKEILRDFNGSVVIASAMHSQEILEEIRAMNVQNSVIII